MPIISLNVRMPWATGAVRGALSSNTYHFDTAAEAPTSANTNTLAEIVGGFYTATLEPWLSSIFTGDLIVSAYNLSDPKPRLPYHVEEMTFTPGADTLPGECSIKMGIQAARQTGVPPQRYRGTLQLGPLVQSVIDAEGRLTESVMDDLEAGVNSFQSAIDTLQAFDWVVGTEAQGFEPVNRVLLSNELGTVRRRQLPYTDRRTVAVVDT